MLLYMYIAPGQGQTTLWGQMLMSTESPYYFAHLLQVLKKNCFEVQFYIHFFHVSPYIYSPGQGQIIHCRQNFDDNRKAFSICPYVASFEMISSKSEFIHIFNDFIHVYSPRARAENPLGTNFWCQQKALITLTIYCNFQTNFFEFWFYTNFLMFFHMYITPGQGQTTLCGQNSDVNRKTLSLCPSVASFKKNIFEVWFYTYFLMFLYMYIAQRQGQTTPWGQNFYVNIYPMSLWSFAISFFH